jgi:hypothetical protein
VSDFSALDRLRIERAVWSLDQRLHDLPRATRIAHRKELRANLVAAAGDVGTTAALRDLGNAASLASDYRDAALGPRPRASWYAAGGFLVTTVVLLTWALFSAAQAFGDGLLAVDHNATGTFRWPGVAYLQSEVTFAVSHGRHNHVGGAFTPLTYVLLLVGTILVGRLWRALPSRSRPAELGRAG